MVTPVLYCPGLPEKGGISMPRLRKKYKQEWQFFLDDRNRMKYNELCKKCERECKQSFRAIIIDCPFERKSRKKKKGASCNIKTGSC